MGGFLWQKIFPAGLVVVLEDWKEFLFLLKVLNSSFWLLMRNHKLASSYLKMHFNCETQLMLLHKYIWHSKKYGKHHFKGKICFRKEVIGVSFHQEISYVFLNVILSKRV